eukprot:5673773-Pyramimonas_sp.AAC.1
MAPGGPQDATRGPKTAPRRLHVTIKPPQEATKRPNFFKHRMNISTFGLLSFLLSMAFRCLKTAQRGPLRARERPKRAPRRPKECPRALQEGSKSQVLAL